MKEARGVSAITLIKTARSQMLSAREHEAKGDLRTALGNYIKAALLTKLTMDSQEYAQENRGKAGGVIRKELNDFLEVRPRLTVLDHSGPRMLICHVRPTDATLVPELLQWKRN